MLPPSHLRGDVVFDGQDVRVALGVRGNRGVPVRPADLVSRCP